MRATIDIHGAILAPVEERRSSYLVPHLTRDHGEAEKQRGNRPHLLVVQKLEIVPFEVQETGHEDEEHGESDSSGVVRWAEHPYL